MNAYLGNDGNPIRIRNEFARYFEGTGVVS